MSKRLLSSMCRRCQAKYTPKPQQTSFSTTSRFLASTNYRGAQKVDPAPQASAQVQQLAKNASNEAQTRPQAGVAPDEPFHMTVFAHKHNTHITFTEPSRDVVLSFSTGNIGFRKGQRGTFDAAYQLASYTFRKMAEKNWRIGGKKSVQPPMTLRDPRVKERGIEVVLRGYGLGREAFQKAILGSEGKMVKGLVKKVTDGTRLKFGGVRSRAVRRLG